jgi:hypothetical protein
MNLGNRQQLLGVLAIVAVALLVGDRLVVTPLIKTWKERTAQLAQMKKSVAQGTQLIERDRVIRERWQTMRTNTLSSEVSIAQNQVLRAFDRWSQDSRVGVNGINTQWRRNEDDFATLECRVDASGTLAEIARFLYEIEKDQLGLKLDIVELTSRDDRGQQLTLALQVSGLQLEPPAQP